MKEIKIRVILKNGKEEWIEAGEDEFTGTLFGGEILGRLHHKREEVIGLDVYTFPLYGLDISSLKNLEYVHFYFVNNPDFGNFVCIGPRIKEMELPLCLSFIEVSRKTTIKNMDELMKNGSAAIEMV